MTPIGFAPLLIGLLFFAQAPTRPSSAGRTHPATFTLWQLPEQTRGQMMSYVIRSVGGKVIVIDGGWAGDAPYLKRFLVGLGGCVEAWFLTHPHRDHVQALSAILADAGPIRIEAVYASLPDEDWVRKYGSEEEHDVVVRFNAQLRAANRRVVELRTGQEIRIDGIRIEVLGVKNPEIHGNAVNNSSLVLRFSDAAKSVLFLGDLGVEGGEKLLRSRYRSRLPADYVQMAHHGQNGVNEAFYKAVDPKYCLWPTPRWLWDNDKGQGKGSGPWKTLEVRAWTDKLKIKRHYVSADGLNRID